MQCLGKHYHEIEDDRNSQLEPMLVLELTHDILPISFQFHSVIRLFSSLEHDGSGEIRIDDFISRCEIKVSTFATIAFSLFDSEGSGGK